MISFHFARFHNPIHILLFCSACIRWIDRVDVGCCAKVSQKIIEKNRQNQNGKKTVLFGCLQIWSKNAFFLSSSSSSTFECDRERYITIDDYAKQRRNSPNRMSMWRWQMKSSTVWLSLFNDEHLICAKHVVCCAPNRILSRNIVVSSSSCSWRMCVDV